MNKEYFYAAVILLLFLAIGIQPALAIDIPTDLSVGTWDGHTYTLTTNVSEGLVIVRSNMILDGAGHTVTPVWPGEGVGFFEKSGITIMNLNVAGGAAGISVRRSNGCTVINNTVSTCDYGIWLADSSNVIVENNNTHSNINHGISLATAMAYGHNNILSNNTVSNNGLGISLGGNTDYNKIYNNTVSKNGIGIHIVGNAQFNTIYNNNFIENPENARVVGADNVFDLGDPEIGGKGGNYWDNWTTPDDDGDGIVDNPYVIPPYGNGQDNFPWAIENGWLPPSPELLIEQLIVKVEALNGQYGIINALDAKLQNALDALEAKNANQREDAVNKMQAFINAVEAQSGNKIPVEVANDLIADANYIISLL